MYLTNFKKVFVSNCQMYLSRIAKCICVKLQMYLYQIAECVCLNLQNIFVSNSKMFLSRIAKCFGLKQQKQQNKLASVVFFFCSIFLHCSTPLAPTAVPSGQVFVEHLPLLSCPKLLHNSLNVH